MNPTLRALLALAAFCGGYVLGWMVLLVLLPANLAVLGPLLSFGCALWLARRTWRRCAAPTSLTASTCAGLGAAVLGSAGFALGFFGPMILAPGANQGPLLGIFITGPAGAALGALGGYLYGRHRRA